MTLALPGQEHVPKWYGSHSRPHVSRPPDCNLRLLDDLKKQPKSTTNTSCELRVMGTDEDRLPPAT